MVLSCAGAERRVRKPAEEASVSECLQVLTRPERERSHGVVSFRSGRETALINTHLLKGRRGKLIEPGQLKSLGTDAFIAFR